MPYDYGDVELIKQITNDTYAKYKHKRFNHERAWYRNILFMLGNQWIKWDEHEHQWRKRRLANWVPTPVTNKFASSTTRLAAILARIEPNWVFVPASDKEEDIVAADVCDMLEGIISEENEIDILRNDISQWLALTGNVFLFSWASARQNFNQQNMTQMPTEMGIPPELMQQPQDYQLYTDILSPFEVYGDLSIPNIEHQEKLILPSRRDKEWVRTTYGISAKETEPEDLGLKYLESIGYINEGETSPSWGSQDKVSRVTIKRMIIKPNEDWPDGLFSVLAGDEIVDSRPLPATKEGQPFNPVTHIKFDNIPGAFFGRTPMNDVIPKQIQRNKLESLIELIALRMASPVWLLPDGTTVKGFSGEPGAILTYTLMGDKATKPDRIPGEQIPSTLINFLEKIDDDIEELVATFSAIKGQAPYSGAPGVVVDQLIEQGLNRFGPALKNIAEGYRSWMKKQIELFRVYAITPRIITQLGENSRWKISKFSAADIMGAVNVRIESDSTIPRSNSVKAARVQAAIQTQLIDITDPLVRLKALQIFGLSELMDNTNMEVISAVRENDILMQGSQVSVKPFVDNHEIHIRKHKALAASEEAAPIMNMIIQHITEHNMTMDAEMNPGVPQGQPQTSQTQGQSQNVDNNAQV